MLCKNELKNLSFSDIYIDTANLLKVSASVLLMKQVETFGSVDYLVMYRDLEATTGGVL